jgi:dTDP-4-amino-4,6-dideoxygalactose transaminase
MDAIMSVAQHHDLAVIEDAAHAFAARYRGELVGSVEDSPLPRVAAFSFYATKNLTTIEGGLLSGSPELVDECRLWSLHGMSKDAWNRYGKGGSWYYEVVRPGYKCNMTDVQASIGIHQLARIEQFQTRRREVVAAYGEGLAPLDAVQLPVEVGDVESAWHLYPIRLHLEALTIDRARFIDELTARNIGTSVHFIPLHHHPYYAERYGLSASDFPVSSGEYLRLISLPMHAGLSDEDVSDVIEAVSDVATTFRR